MTTIPNLNIVIQHGDAARETQQIRNQPLEAAQGTLWKRDESDDIKRTVTQPLDEPDRLMFEKDKQQQAGSKYERPEARRGRRRRESPPEKPKADSGEPGTLLDTVA